MLSGDVPLWLHEGLSRQQTDLLLMNKNDGSFLVREIDNQLVLSVKTDQNVSNYRIRKSEKNKIYINPESTFDNIVELVKYYSTHDELRVRLKLPVLRTIQSGDSVQDIDQSEIPSEEIDIKYRLDTGGGRYGDVYEALWTRYNKQVAVRRLNPIYAKPVKEAIEESKFLKDLQHPNVVQFFGMCCQVAPIQVVTEFMAGGNLLNYIYHKTLDITPSSTLYVAIQIASGMSYLASKFIIHHDLETRTCFIGQNVTVKVGGYELHRLIELDDSRTSDRWMAPETMKNLQSLSTMSNVWSFGILLWELATLGCTPYPDVIPHELYFMLERGYRMDKPLYCSDDLYNVMITCWQWIPEERPTFSNLCTKLQVSEESVKAHIQTVAKNNDLSISIEDCCYHTNITTAEVVFKYKEVLKEIRHLGFETQTDFEEIMQKGSYECYWNRVYLVGNYNVGKTTLAKVLVRDKVPEVRKSTDGIWLYIGLAGMDVEQRKWIFLPKGSAIKTILTTMLMSIKIQEGEGNEGENTNSNAEQNTDMLKEEETKPSLSTDRLKLLKEDSPINSHPQCPRSSFQVESMQFTTGPKDTSIGKILQAVSNEKLRDMVIEAAKEGKYKMKIVPIDIWDFGGQKDYYMTHQLFITSRGIFVLMFNGSIDIHKHMPDLSFLPGHYGRPTVAVYLRHWVNSILTYRKRTDNYFPRILFVATHKDIVPRDEVESRRNSLIADIESLFKSHAGYGHLEFKSLLFIDARNESDPDVATLRHLLIDRAFEHPRWGEDMPTAWVPLEIELAQEVEAGNNIILRSQLQLLNNQNKSFTLNDRQLESFLKIQHSLGKLIYFDETHLRNFIIINPVFMIEVLRSIVCDKQFWPRGEQFIDAHRRLRETGWLHKNTIFSIWEQEEFKQIGPHKDFILDTLIKLDIIVPARSVLESLQIPDHTVSFFLVPCMITNPNSTDYIEMNCQSSTSIIMAYTFIDDVIPPALSYRFLGSCLGMWDIKLYKGQHMLFSDLAVVKVGKNHDVAIRVKDKRLIVTLINTVHKHKIEPILASSVQECLTAAIHRISEFYSSLTNDGGRMAGHDSSPFHIEFGVYCQSSVCFFHHTKMPSTLKSMWKCPEHHDNHDVRCLRHWYCEKRAAESCPSSCKGPGKLEMEQCPSDQHIRRLVSELSFSTCRELAIHLGLKTHIWDDLTIQFQHDNIENIKFMAVWKWKQKSKKACFSHLKVAMESCHVSIHDLCQVFRDIQLDSEIPENVLETVPSFEALKHVSDFIGNSSLQLGIELGLDIPEMENIQKQLKNKPLEQTREILKRWREYSHLNNTVRTLVKAPNRIDKAACLNDITF